MPASLLIPAITAGAALLGQGGNAVAQGMGNRAQRKWNEKMYQTQKQDNLDFWNMQNSYNSPEQQMQRLTSAGLNPNLVYGNGAVANSSSAPDTPHAMPYNPKVPELNLPAVADTYFNLQSQSQRLANDKLVGDNMLLENQLKQEAIKSAKLNNTFNAEMYGSKVRGFLGDNENKYQNAIKSFLNADLLEYLSGHSGTRLTPMGTRSTQTGNEGDSLLVKDWMENYRAKKLGNTLKVGAAERNRLDNSIKSTQNQYQERLMRGNIEDISAQDWIKMLIQGLGIVPSYNRN